MLRPTTLKKGDLVSIKAYYEGMKYDIHGRAYYPRVVALFVGKRRRRAHGYEYGFLLLDHSVIWCGAWQVNDGDVLLRFSRTE